MLQATNNAGERGEWVSELLETHRKKKGVEVGLYCSNDDEPRWRSSRLILSLGALVDERVVQGAIGSGRG